MENETLRYADLPDAGDQALEDAVVTAWWQLVGEPAGARSLPDDVDGEILDRARFRAVQLPLAAFARVPRSAAFHLADDDIRGYETVQTLVAVLRNSGAVPPVVVRRNAGRIELLDGLHRLTAHAIVDRRTVSACELIGFAPTAR